MLPSLLATDQAMKLRNAVAVNVCIKYQRCRSWYVSDPLWNLKKLVYLQLHVFVISLKKYVFFLAELLMCHYVSVTSGAFNES